MVQNPILVVLMMMMGFEEGDDEKEIEDVERQVEGGERANKRLEKRGSDTEQRRCCALPRDLYNIQTGSAAGKPLENFGLLRYAPGFPVQTQIRVSSRHSDKVMSERKMYSPSSSGLIFVGRVLREMQLSQTGRLMIKCFGQEEETYCDIIMP